MQICRQSIGFVFRVVKQAETSFLRQKPSVFLTKIKSYNCSVLNFLQNNFIQIPIMGKPKGGFYAVARGRRPGIYFTWDECKAQVDGFTSARYKKFGSSNEAQAFIEEHSSFPQKSQIIKPSVKSSGLAEKVGLTKMSVTKPTSSFPKGQPSRNFSTTSALNKRKFNKVTEERITNKRPKMSGPPNSNINLTDFTVEDGYIVVYTDGACTKNGRLGAKAGIGIWFGDNHNLNVAEPVKGRQTNNTAEILAAEKAIVQAKNHGIDKLHVKTDSQFVINCITQWIQKWKRNNWQLSNGKSVVNRNELERLDDAMLNMDIKWSYVPGHRGVYGNECADQLAVEGANKK